jgi:hypothetical protein
VVKTQNVSRKSGLTRGKAALIGVLTIVLAGVIYVQYGRRGDEGVLTPTNTAAYRPPARRAAPPTASESALQAESELNIQSALLDFDQTRWKSPELSTVIAYDPFALPAAFPQPPQAGGDPRLAAGPLSEAAAALRAKLLADAIERLQMQLEELKQRGVHVIVNQNDHYVAMIGDRMIHVGDEINGFTVTEIDPKGVRVERKDPE